MLTPVARDQAATALDDEGAEGSPAESASRRRRQVRIIVAASDRRLGRGDERWFGSDPQQVARSCRAPGPVEHLRDGRRPVRRRSMYTLATPPSCGSPGRGPTIEPLEPFRAAIKTQSTRR